MNSAFRILTVVLSLHTAATVQADDDFAAASRQNWHQWRGPHATGVAPVGDPPIHWDDTRNVTWKTAIPGSGKSSPIVWEGKVFLTTAINTGQVVEGTVKPEDQPERPFGIKFPDTLFRFNVLCLDRETGDVLWERTATEALPHEGHHGDNSHASASPTTDGKRLYVSFGSRGLYCYDLEGALQWKRGLNNVSTRLSFGEASSPVVHGDVLILNRDNEGNSRILAFHAATGEPLWDAKRDEPSAWATPVVVEHNGRTQVITNASHRVRSYELSTGKLLWECGGQVSNVTPCPVILDDHVICMSGYRGSSAMSLPLDAEGDISGSARVAWKIGQDTPYVPSPLLYGNRLYFNKLNSAILTCLDAKTGQPILEATRLEGLSNVYASPVGCADRVYYVGRDGVTLVLKNSAPLEVLATNRMDDSFDASPAISGRQLFLRGREHLYCLESR